MLGIKASDLAPIRAVADIVHAGDDRQRPGAWGMLYLVCGALAGWGPSWKATIGASFGDSLPAAFQEYLNEMKGVHTGRDVAYKFSELILVWLSDRTIRGVAASRLNTLLASRPSQPDSGVNSAMIEYVTLAVALNSFSVPMEGEPGIIRHWANGHPDGWETLFFGAGLILGSNARFPVLALRTAFLGMTPPGTVDFAGLLRTYEADGRR